jgi:hypothetical protein
VADLHSRFMSLRCNSYNSRNAIVPSCRTTSFMSPVDTYKH